VATTTTNKTKKKIAHPRQQHNLLEDSFIGEKWNFCLVAKKTD